MKKIKTYVLTVSQNFPKTHNMAGQPTNFVELIRLNSKLHTIRGNYELWKKRFKEIEKGNAMLSVRIWEGKPYKSKQKQVFSFYNNNCIGIQKLIFANQSFPEPFIEGKNEILSNATIAKNDGLPLDDFKEWFKGYDLSEPMAIIHFTPFRY